MKKSSVKQPCAYHESNLGGVLVNKHITIKILLFLGWKNDILQWKSNCKYNLGIRESAPANYKKGSLFVTTIQRQRKQINIQTAIELPYLKETLFPTQQLLKNFYGFCNSDREPGS